MTAHQNILPELAPVSSTRHLVYRYAAPESLRLAGSQARRSGRQRGVYAVHGTRAIDLDQVLEVDKGIADRHYSGRQRIVIELEDGTIVRAVERVSRAADCSSVWQDLDLEVARLDR